MKHTRRLALLLTTSLLAFPAVASSVTMLQFGSFETREEAERRLSEIKTKHAAPLAGVELSVREVQLPPNGLTVYRTQAGPVASRPFAQTICTKFAAKGDECYIVQTAMTVPAKPPLVIADASVPSPAVVAAPAAQAAPSVFAPAEEPAAPPPPSAPPSVFEQADAAADNTPKETESFWSRLNPFSEDEAPAPAVALPEPSPEVANVAAQMMNPSPHEALPAPVLPDAPAASAPEAPPLTEAELMQLPPPPEPLNPAALPAIADAVPPRPMPEPLLAGGLTPAPLPDPLPAASGHVNVGEAERVPVTDVPLPPPAIVEAPLSPPVLVAHPPSQLQSPSATAGQKTLWAQMGPFSNGTSAVQFWANYRMSHPDFPVVRVRVTSPYQQQVAGNREFWLRVGPMARTGSVDHLCASIAAMQHLRCGQVTDMGVAAATRVSGTLPGTRYARQSIL